MRTLRTSWMAVIALVLSVAVLTACGDAGRRDGSAAAPPAATVQPSDTAAAGATTVHVTTKDFSFALDTTTVPAGPVTFIVRNDGDSAHDFRLTGNSVKEKTPIIKSGETASLTVELKPGAYEYVCNIPRHEMMGMKGTLTVR